MEGGIKNSTIRILITNYFNITIMKKYSASWNSSVSKRKQRKCRFQSPLHIKHKLMSSQLSEELRTKHKMKSIPIRKDDEVKIMRGKFKGKSGKVKNVQMKKLRVNIEKMQNQKKDGTKIDVWFHPSNLQIISLNLEDKKRLPMTENKKQKIEEVKKTEKKENKTPGVKK